MVADPLRCMCLLYWAFGWQIPGARVRTSSLLLKPDGNGKLSKRDGDRLGFPVFPLEWHDPKTGGCLQVIVNRVICLKRLSISLPCWDGIRAMTRN